MTTTYSRESDWIGVPASSTVASHRATTSSRHPGVVFASAVYRERTTALPCARCGHLRLIVGNAVPGPHSPRWAEVAGSLRLVDCVGDALETT